MKQAALPTLPWSDALQLDLPLMDAHHHDFVDAVAAVEAATDGELPAAWRALIVHTDEHFGAEDRWMRDTRFAESNCHSLQHMMVLRVLRDAEQRALDGDLGLLRVMARELATWFPQHLQSMDAALALHLRTVGYDARSGAVLNPAALPAQPITGCGGACSQPT